MFAGELKSTLLSVVSKTPDRVAVRSFVDQCFTMGQVYLKRKARAGKLDPGFFGLTLDDLTLDCIADLFERDEDGTFPQLVAYYGPLDVASQSETSLLMATRRLVFSKVSEGLFRRYRETDAALGKMIRNLRYNLTRVDGVREDRRGGELWVYFGEGGAEDPRPLLAPELLEARLMTYMHAGIDLKEVLRALRHVLASHEDYAPAYPLTGLASIVESAFQRLAEPPAPTQPAMHRLHAEDITQFIEGCMQTVRDKMLPKYVGKKKVTKVTFEAYFAAVRDILHAQCVSEHAADASYYDHLQSYLSTLSYEDYRQHHRTRLEYVVKQTREHFLARIARHW